MNQQLSPMDQATLLAGHAVSYATAFLDGRHSAWQLCRNTELLQHQLLTMSRDAESNELLDPIGLLTATMMHAARACLPESPAPDDRRERWMFIMASFVDLIRMITNKLAKD